jgi:hypothetical protein
MEEAEKNTARPGGMSGFEGVAMNTTWCKISNRVSSLTVVIRGDGK